MHQLERLPLLRIVLASFLMQFPARRVNSTPIDNGVEGTPTISCGDEMIEFWVKTRNPFNGKVYIKGEYANPLCVQDHDNSTGPPPSRSTEAVTSTSAISTSSTTGSTSSPISSSSTSSTGTTSLFTGSTCQPCPVCKDGPAKAKDASEKVKDPRMAHLNVKLGTCNVKRDRQLNPKGVLVQFTVVVSFHPSFITKVDKAYQLRCFYMEADKTVTSELDVSMPPTTELVGSSAMPVCSYTIRRGTPDGPQIRYAKIGDKVYHVWQCNSDQKGNISVTAIGYDRKRAWDTVERALPYTGTFGMLVHNCYVNDGHGRRVEVLSSKGCSIDRYALGDLTYPSNDTSSTDLQAWVESHVFKFADQTLLDFQCAISICVRVGGSCDGITPPNCAQHTLIRSKREETIAEAVNHTVFVNVPENEWELHAPRVHVVDLDDDVPSEQLQKYERDGLRADAEGLDSNFEVDHHNPTPWLASPVLPDLGTFSAQVCLSVVGFGLLVGISTFVFTIAAIVVGTLYVLRRKQAKECYQPSQRFWHHHNALNR